MPWKDKQKRAEVAAKYRKEQYRTITLSIRNDSGIPRALDLMVEDLEMPPATYAQQALAVQLRKDGYLKDSE